MYFNTTHNRLKDKGFLRCPQLTETLARLGVNLDGEISLPVTLTNYVTKTLKLSELNVAGIFGLEAINPDADHLFVCECPLDCAVLITLGFNAIAVLGNAETLSKFVGKLPVVKTFVWSKNEAFAESVAQELTRTVHKIDADPAYDLLLGLNWSIDAAKTTVRMLMETAVPIAYTYSYPVMSALNLPDGDDDRIWLVKGLVPKGAVIGLYGEAGIGKSTFLINLAVSVALGRPFLGKPTEKSIVLYIDTENPPLVLKRKLEALCGDLGCLSDSLFFIKDKAISPADSVDNLWGFVKETFSQLGGRTPDLVIIDTLNDFLPLDDYNDEAQARSQVSVLRQLRKTFNCTVIAVGHTPKGQAPSSLRWRGSQARFETVDIALDFQKCPKNPDLIKLVVAKDRFGMLMQNFVIRRGRQFDFIALPDSPLPDSARRILDLLKQSYPNQLTLRDIINRTNLPKRTANHNLKRLQEMGLIEKVARNLYKSTNP